MTELSIILPTYNEKDNIIILINKIIKITKNYKYTRWGMLIYKKQNSVLSFFRWKNRTKNSFRITSV